MPTPDIVEWDPTAASDAEVDEVYALQRACHLEVAAGEPFFPREEVVAFLRHPPADDVHRHWRSRPDGLAACAWLRVEPGRRTGYVKIFVAPPSRRRGLGSALFAAAVASARAMGLVTVSG